jgi:hypothetical protein
MITRDDLLRYKAFKNIVHKSKIELQGEAVIMASSLYQWFESLEKKLEFCEAKFSSELAIATAKEKESPIKVSKK